MNLRTSTGVLAGMTAAEVEEVEAEVRALALLLVTTMPAKVVGVEGVEGGEPAAMRKSRTQRIWFLYQTATQPSMGLAETMPTLVFLARET